MNTAADTLFRPDLLAKYNANGPRYTSYPTAFSSARLSIPPTTGAPPPIQARHGTDLSLYFHIPFCDTVCFYCGCNKVVTKNRAHARPYLEQLKREMALQAAFFDTTPSRVAVALGRRHADVPVARRNGRTDGRDARALHVAAR